MPGQEDKPVGWLESNTKQSRTRLKTRAKGKMSRAMGSTARNSWGRLAERTAAAAVCLALLYFAAGGSFLHAHKSGPETVCHVCQSLHAPALAVSPGGLALYLQLGGWHQARPMALPRIDEFRSHRFGRAPPSL